MATCRVDIAGLSSPARQPHAATRCQVTRPLTREEALGVLQLPGSAGASAAKRAYRRLARVHHPDAGGDGHTFHLLQLAYERLATEPDPEGVPRVARGRPSRAAAAWEAEIAVDRSPVDVQSVDWTMARDEAATVLHRDAVAAHLADGDQPLVRPLTATSRHPGSRLNRIAHHLSSDLTAQLRVRAGADDRRRPVVVVEVRAGARRARRALDQCALDDPWVRLRGSSATVLRSTLAPSEQRRATAVRATDRLEVLLDRLSWPLPSWTRLH